VGCEDSVPAESSIIVEHSKVFVFEYHLRLTASYAISLLLLLLVCVIDRLDPLITSIVKELFPYIQGREGGREGRKQGRSHQA
jgi:hypothetical protein